MNKPGVVSQYSTALPAPTTATTLWSVQKNHLYGMSPGATPKDGKRARIALMRARLPRDFGPSNSAMPFTAQQGMGVPGHILAVIG
jgi:hypothetical protein